MAHGPTKCVGGVVAVLGTILTWPFIVPQEGMFVFEMVEPSSANVRRHANVDKKSWPAEALSLNGTIPLTRESAVLVAANNSIGAGGSKIPTNGTNLSDNLGTMVEQAAPAPPPVPQGNTNPTPPPKADGASFAVLVLGWDKQPRPIWAEPEDDIYLYCPPQECQPCPASSKKLSGASWKYAGAPEAWWCAQRHYLVGVGTLLEKYPDKDYYFLADADTMVFRHNLKTLMQLLSEKILSTTGDLYTGHGYDLTNAGVGPIIMSGGGVLIRGLTLRRLRNTGNLETCQHNCKAGAWCWHHLDWALSECLRTIGVLGLGHHAFQQNTCLLPHSARLVACHPVKRTSLQEALHAQHLAYFQVPENRQRLTPNWASPCTAYMWKYDAVSYCKSQESAFVGMPLPTMVQHQRYSTSAFLIWGPPPAWLAPDDVNTAIFYMPPKECSRCTHPPGDVKPLAESMYQRDAPVSWWCAHRHYLLALWNLVNNFANVHWYVLATPETVVFREALEYLIQHLSNGAIPPESNLVAGHGYDLARDKLHRFIMADGGVLIRGRSLRYLVLSGALKQCIEMAMYSAWCWYHFDWAIAACFAKVKIFPEGHQAFQQHGCGNHTNPALVSCRAGAGTNHVEMITKHQKAWDSLPQQFGLDWMKTCPRYDWRSPHESRCIVGNLQR